jgi:hypothetical protein
MEFDLRSIPFIPSKILRNMTTFFEGKFSQTNIAGLSATAARSQLKDFLAHRKLNTEQAEIVEEFTKNSIDAVERQFALVRRHRLDPAGWFLDVGWAEFKSFNACAGFACHPDLYCIKIALEAPATLLSMAHELDCLAHLPCENSQPFLTKLLKRISPHWFSNRFAINDWLKDVGNKSDVSQRAMIRAADALLLLFFHELAHVLFGHCKAVGLDSDEIRALEADADFNAGSMLAGALIGEGVPVTEIQERLILAGLLLGTVFKAISPKSRKYHYPTIRAAMMIEGGAFVLGKTKGLLPSFQSTQELDSYWTNIRGKHEPNFLRALRMSSMAYFSGTESGLRRDVQDLGQKTLRVRERLKNGILSETSILNNLRQN